MAERGNVRQAFVVVGEPPSAIGVRSGEVKRVLEPSAFTGATTLDLAPLHDACVEAEAPAHVLVLRGENGDLGLLVRGRLELMSVAPGDVLELPPAVGRKACLSHVIAVGGVPAIPVLDAARAARGLADLLLHSNTGTDPET